jgi:hypothetical protein
MLREASNVSGVDGGKTLTRETIITEFALAQLASQPPTSCTRTATASPTATSPLPSATRAAWAS